jgi:hypothetical protein
MVVGDGLIFDNQQSAVSTQHSAKAKPSEAHAKLGYLGMTLYKSFRFLVDGWGEG